MDENKTSVLQNEETQNAYEEEQIKVEDEKKERIELAMRIRALLDDYGYDIVAKDKAGVPYVDFVKRM